MSVRLGILGLIQEKPRHGYELHSAFTALVGGKNNWEVKPSQIYTTLNRLLKSGLITEEGIEKAGGPEKTIFSVTTKGSQKLLEWLRESTPSQHRRDEFYLKLMLSISTGIVDSFELIYNQRSSLYRELHSINLDKLKLDKDSELALFLLMEQASMRIEADLRWLDMVEGRLDEIKSQPIPQPLSKHRGRPSSKSSEED